MKKILIVFIAFFLVSCGINENKKNLIKDKDQFYVVLEYDSSISKIEGLDYNAYLAYQSNVNIPKRNLLKDLMEGEEGVVFWADKPLYNVEIIGIYYEIIPTIGDYGFTENSDYKDKQEFGDITEEDAILLTRTIAEGVPYWALSFEDENGIRTNLILTYDGSGLKEFPTYFLFDLN